MRLILFLLIVSIDASRYSLNPERVTWWQIKGDSNQGPSYAQPEQVALSYGGKCDEVPYVRMIIFFIVKNSN